MRREKWFSFLSIPSRYDFIRTSSHNFHSSETRAGAYLIVSEQCSNSRTDWKNKETAECPLKSQTHNLLCAFISMRMHPKKFQQVECLSPLLLVFFLLCVHAPRANWLVDGQTPLSHVAQIISIGCLLFIRQSVFAHFFLLYIKISHSTARFGNNDGTGSSFLRFSLSRTAKLIHSCGARRGKWSVKIRSCGQSRAGQMAAWH